MKAYVWKAHIWKDGDRWLWCCALCQPIAYGSRTTWAAIINTSLPNHFRHRRYHHDWASRQRASRRRSS